MSGHATSIQTLMLVLYSGCPVGAGPWGRFPLLRVTCLTMASAPAISSSFGDSIGRPHAVRRVPGRSRGRRSTDCSGGFRWRRSWQLGKTQRRPRRAIPGSNPIPIWPLAGPLTTQSMSHGSGWRFRVRRSDFQVTGCLDGDSGSPRPVRHCRPYGRYRPGWTR